MATVLMATSAAIILALGAIHLIYTFRGLKLTPRDPSLQAAMTRVSPVISRETTMWKAWIGFNASHSLGAILFGLIYGYLATAKGALLFNSPFLLIVGLALLGSLAVLGKLYWFSVPFTGICVALACYVTAIALAWA